MSIINKLKIKSLVFENQHPKGRNVVEFKQFFVLM